MADNRLELPCGEPLVEVWLPHGFRYPVRFSHGLMCKMNAGAQLHCPRPLSELTQAIDM